MSELRNAANPTMLDPANDDSALLALERQFNEVAADLFGLQHARDALAACSVSRSSEPRSELLGAEYSEEVRTRQLETILARLDPIERAIMATPAHSIAGLGVKARHAAYAMSQYWVGPVDQIEWEAKAVRLLIEAVCEVAGVPLPFRDLTVDK
ncbi:hypothetical protein [Bradyrhizobium sp.]|uniref:hypothetical protein n=1 Tax=Bradyrhizobium sp. TaxID=376 RepID=UPI003C68E9B2